MKACEYEMVTPMGSTSRSAAPGVRCASLLVLWSAATCRRFGMLDNLGSWRLSIGLGQYPGLESGVVPPHSKAGLPHLVSGYREPYLVPTRRVRTRQNSSTRSRRPLTVSGRKAPRQLRQNTETGVDINFGGLLRPGRACCVLRDSGHSKSIDINLV